MGHKGKPRLLTLASDQKQILGEPRRLVAGFVLPNGCNRPLGMVIFCQCEGTFQETSQSPGSGVDRTPHSAVRNQLLQPQSSISGKRKYVSTTCFGRLTSHNARASVPERKWVTRMSRGHNSVGHSAEGL